MPRHSALAILGYVGITDTTGQFCFYAAVSMALSFFDVPSGATGMPR